MLLSLIFFRIVINITVTFYYLKTVTNLTVINISDVLRFSSKDRLRLGPTVVFELTGGFNFVGVCCRRSIIFVYYGTVHYNSVSRATN